MTSQHFTFDLTPNDIKQEKDEEPPKTTKRIDDFIIMGRYVVYICILAEFMILAEVSSMFYMVYAGAAPKLLSCGEDYFFDSALEGKEKCFVYQGMAGNCTNPKFTYQFKSVNVEWTYFCETSKMVKNSIAVQMTGVLLGSVVFGQISDSFGRKLSLNLSMFGMFLGWLLVAQSDNLTHFTATRTIVGFFTGGNISVLNVFIMENIPKRHRMWINMMITWAPNMPIVALIAYLTQDWVSLAYANAITCVPGIVFCVLLVHDSPRWLATRGRMDEAKAKLVKQLKVSKQEHLLGQEFEDVIVNEYEISQQASSKRQQYSYHHLFYTWRLALTTVVLAYSYFSTSIINYGILFNMEKLSGSIYLNSVYTGLIRYACNLSCGYLDLKFKRIGRKFIHTIGLLVVIVSLTIVVLSYVFGLNHQLKEEIRIAILIGNSMTAQIYIADGIVGNELFPTPIRNLGYSFLQLWNRVGVILSPFIFYLADYWIPLPFCVIIMLATIDTVSFECLLPETKGKPLVEQMPRKEERIFYRRTKKRENVEDNRLVADY